MNIRIITFLSLFLTSSPLYSSHIDPSELEYSMDQLNKGEKAYCFIPLNFNEEEKEFLTDLKVTFSKEAEFGRQYSITSSISFSEAEKSNEDSVFNIMKTTLRTFFAKNTNADQLNKNIKGSNFLTDVLMEYCERLTKSYKSNHLHLVIKTMKEDNTFQNFPRWHFDGNQYPGKNLADINFAGVFCGSPTIFANIKEEKFKKIYDLILKERENFRKENYLSKEELINEINCLSQYPHNLKDSNLSQEIEIIQGWDDKDIEIKSKRLEGRMRVFNYLRKNEALLSIDTSEPFQAALFTMDGKKPALHSEPFIDQPRLFFAIRLDEENRNNRSEIGEITLSVHQERSLI